MKVLVTGVAGFLGSWIAESLLKAGHFVVGSDNLLGGDRDNVPSACKFRDTDIRSLYSMTQLCDGCDAVYHCVALAYEGLSVFSPSMVANNVVGGTVSVATAAARRGVKRFVNCSSMARYGDARMATAYEEDDTPHPVDPYGASKLAAERITNIIGECHGMKVLHAVPHNIYGPRQKYDDPYRNVAAIFANLMLQGRQPRVYGDGQQVRCFSRHVDRFVRELTRLGLPFAAHFDHCSDEFERQFREHPLFVAAHSVRILHWGIMDMQRAQEHRERWDAIYTRKVGRNPYGGYEYYFDPATVVLLRDVPPECLVEDYL